MNGNTFVSLLFNVYAHFGWIGSLVILAGCLITALPYRGRAAEKYSILNHFISELGEIGVSKLAMVFNIGMIIGGALFLPFIAGLGLVLGTVWAYIGMAAGLLAAVSSILVGVFSMDRLEPHRKAAMTFFRSGLVTVLFFTIAVFVQPAGQRVIPLAVNIFGILAIISYSAFLVIVSQKTNKKGEENYLLDPTEKKSRPRFWRTPFLEWMLFFATIAWFLCVSLILIF
jgi:LytS/YehU family sensor histidine kinase